MRLRRPSLQSRSWNGRFVGLAALVASLVVGLLAVVPTSSAAAYDFPSTNDDNRDNGVPHVDLDSTGPGTVTLEFVNTTNSLAAFEYRIDGHTVGTDTHPVIHDDVIHPTICVDGRTTPACPTSPVTHTFTADTTIEIRLALGGERDRDFDWTLFTVGPPSDSGGSELSRQDCRRRGWTDAGFDSRRDCLRFVRTGVDPRPPDTGPEPPTEEPDPDARRDCRRSGWQDFGFENRRDCIHFVRTGTDRRAAVS